MSDWEKSTAQLIDELITLRQRVTELEHLETEYQQAKQAFRASEACLAGILDISIESIISTDKKQRIILFNKGAEILFGYSAEEVIGKSLDMLIPERFQLIHRQHMQTFEKSGVTARQMAERSEVYGMRKSGEEFPAEASISKLHINEGTIFTVVLRDIIGRKATEEALRSSEQQMRLLLEQRNQELEILLGASQQIAGNINIDDLLTTVTKAIVSSLPQAEAASLWLYNKQMDLLVAHAWAGYSDATMSDLSISTGQCMVGLVYRSGTTHNFFDVQDEVAYDPLARPGLDQIRSALGVPILAGKQVLGVIFADNFSRTVAFDKNDERLMQGLAVQISMALQNMNLFEQLVSEREQTRYLARQVIAAQESERQRVSRELHDETGQALVLLKQGLQQVQRDLSKDFEQVRQRVVDSISLSEQTLERVRTLAYDLRPPLLDTLELHLVLEEYCQEFTERTGIVVDFSGKELPVLSDSIRITLYRVLQESLTNVVKHADADKIRVILDYGEDKINLFVEDNGNGFDTNKDINGKKNRHSIGLVGLRERIQTVNGRLDVVSEPGEGTQLNVYIPLENNQ